MQRKTEIMPKNFCIWAYFLLVPVICTKGRPRCGRPWKHLTGAGAEISYRRQFYFGFLTSATKEHEHQAQLEQKIGEEVRYLI